MFFFCSWCVHTLFVSPSYPPYCMHFLIILMLLFALDFILFGAWKSLSTWRGKWWPILKWSMGIYFICKVYMAHCITARAEKISGFWRFSTGVIMILLNCCIYVIILCMRCALKCGKLLEFEFELWIHYILNTWSESVKIKCKVNNTHTERETLRFYFSMVYFVVVVVYDVCEAYIMA